MIQTPGPNDILTLAWWLISHERRALVEATLLSWVILSVNASIASVLLPEVLVQLLSLLLAFFWGFVSARLTADGGKPASFVAVW